MSPALAARVHRSVRGTGNGARLSSSHKRALLRVLLVGGIVALGVTLGLSYRKAARRLETARHALLGRVQREKAARPPMSEAFLALAARSVVDAATQADPSPILLPPESLASLFTRPSLYVRGSARDFTLAQDVIRRAADTRKDALLACLLDPPADAGVLTKVRGVYRGGAFLEPPFARVRLLHDLVVSTTYLGAEFEQRILEAKQPTRITELERIFDQAHLDRLRDASRAELLIYAVDEPKVPGTIVELDGASDHFIRVGVVDLRNSTVLLRERVHAEPRLFPQKNQARYLAGLSECQAAQALGRPPLSL